MKLLLKSRRLFIVAVVLLLIVAGIITAVTVTGGNRTRQASKQLSLGEKYLSELDYDKAIIAFNKVIQIEPRNIRAYLGLAEAYEGLGRTEDVIGALEAAIFVIKDIKNEGNETPDNIEDIYIKLAEVYEMNGESEKAFRTLLEAYKMTNSIRIAEMLKGYYPEIEPSLKPGTYSQEQLVSLISTGNKIYFTLDGVEPTKESFVFVEPIKIIEGNTTIKAISENEFGELGEVMTFTYNVVETFEPTYIPTIIPQAELATPTPILTPKPTSKPEPTNIPTVISQPTKIPSPNLKPLPDNEDNDFINSRGFKMYAGENYVIRNIGNEMYILYIEGKGHFQLISKEDNGREDYFNKWDSDSFLVAVGDEVELHILKNVAIIAPNGITIEKVKTRKLVEESILKAGKNYIITRDDSDVTYASLYNSSIKFSNSSESNFKYDYWYKYSNSFEETGSSYIGQHKEVHVSIHNEDMTIYYPIKWGVSIKEKKNTTLTMVTLKANKKYEIHFDISMYLDEPLDWMWLYIEDETYHKTFYTEYYYNDDIIKEEYNGAIMVVPNHPTIVQTYDELQIKIPFEWLNSTLKFVELN